MRGLLYVGTALTCVACATTPGGGDGDDDDLGFADADPFDFADASGGPADATPPDACTPQWVNLLADPDFDVGGGAWVQNPAGLIVSSSPAPHTAPNAAYMGISNSVAHEVSQVVLIPADASMLRVRGQLYVSTSEAPNAAYDRLDIKLFDGGGIELAHLPGTPPTASNLTANNAFTAFEYAAPMAFAGQQVRLAFLVTMDGSIRSDFVVDTVALEAFACPP
jgi:hypothetical protein